MTFILLFQCELSMVLYPVFVHMYLELVYNAHQPQGMLTMFATLANSEIRNLSKDILCRLNRLSCCAPSLVDSSDKFFHYLSLFLQLHISLRSFPLIRKNITERISNSSLPSRYQSRCRETNFLITSSELVSNHIDSIEICYL